MVYLMPAVEVLAHGDRAARLRRIHFDNVPRTRGTALLEETTALYDCTTLRQLVQRSGQAAQHMVDVGLLRRANVVVDVDEEAAAGDGYELYFVAEEPQTSKGQVWFGVDNRGETQATVDYSRSSVRGAGETASAQWTRGSRGTALFNVSAAKPLLGWQRYQSLAAHLFRNRVDQTWANFDVTETGATAEANFRSLGNRLLHQLRLNGCWRDLSVASGARFAVREHAGHSLKTSVEHVATYTTRDSAVLPTRGSLVRLTTELAGGGGDTSFLKNHARLSTVLPGPWGAALSLGAVCSHVTARRGCSSLSPIDRVFLGGATDLRGFALNSVDGGDDSDVGGTSAWAAGAQCFVPLFPPNLLYLHAFAVAGNVSAAAAGEPLATTCRRLAATEPRMSVGAGVALNLVDICRLEFNYTVPLKHRSTDSVQQGFQFGVGVSFL